MYGLTRATLTLIGAAAAGAMLRLATTVLPENVSDASLGGYWAAFGLVAIGGLVMALSQLLGGWTKWGWPRVSEPRVPGRVPADTRSRRLDAGRARAGELLARAACSKLVRRHRDRRSRHVARPHGPGDRIRDRARLRAHIRHDRPADPAQDEAGPAGGAQPPPRPAADGNGRVEGTGEFASVTTDAIEAQSAREPAEPVKK